MQTETYSIASLTEPMENLPEFMMQMVRKWQEKQQAKAASGKPCRQKSSASCTMEYGVETGADGLYYMRARYYNPQIKRFINRDIIDGSITDSQSLNKYSYVQGNPVNLIDPFGLCAQDYFSRAGHELLDWLGFIFDPADVINFLWYTAEGNAAMAAATAVAIVPAAGSFIAKGTKQAIKAGKKAAQKAGEKAAKNATEKAAKKAAKKKLAKEAGKEAAEKGAEKAAKEAAEKATEKTAKETAEKTAKAAAEKGIKSSRISNLDDGLNIINNPIIPHWNGTKIIELPDFGEAIKIVDGQAVYVEDDCISLI